MSEIKVIIKKKDGSTEEVKGIMKQNKDNKKINFKKEVKWKDKLEEIKHIIDELDDDIDNNVSFLNKPSSQPTLPPSSQPTLPHSSSTSLPPLSNETKKTSTIILWMKKNKIIVILVCLISIFLFYYFLINKKNTNSPTPKQYSPFSRTNTPKIYQ